MAERRFKPEPYLNSVHSEPCGPETDLSGKFRTQTKHDAVRCSISYSHDRVGLRQQERLALVLGKGFLQCREDHHSTDGTCARQVQRKIRGEGAHATPGEPRAQDAAAELPKIPDDAAGGTDLRRSASNRVDHR